MTYAQIPSIVNRKDKFMPLSQSDLDRFKSLYLQTARAYINDMLRNIVLVKENFDNADAITVMHMASHSLTSQSLLMGYENIGHFSAILESVFKAKKENVYELNEEMLNNMESGIKKIQDSLANIEASGQELDLSAETQKLQELVRLH